MTTLLIRKEGKNIWERRVPLVPGDLKEIIGKTGVKAYVERSEKRFFEEAEYEKIGAEICDSMAPGEIVLGIKEIPEPEILPNKTYVYFSHTIKGQPDNMPMLKKVLESGATLVDYERICDANGVRQVYFGPFAGDAGTLDLFWLMGEYWRAKGISTPFEACRQAMTFQSLDQAVEHTQKVGRQIRQKGLDKRLTPFVVGVLGYGNVAKGAKRILECLPVKEILPADLSALPEKGQGDPRTVYVSVFEEKHLVRPKENKPFDLKDYYQNPRGYENAFEPYLPYMTLLVNAVYWEKRYPKFVTWDGLKRLFETRENPSLAGIVDISCDTAGAVECNVKTTDIGNPCYRVDPVTRKISDGPEGDGILILAVDNLPAELPFDASSFFSNQFKAFVPALIRADLNNAQDISGLPEALQNAVIVHKGALTPKYEYLKNHLEGC